MTDKEIYELITIAYAANNHARRLTNIHEPDNKKAYEKINARAEWLAKRCVEETIKIVKS